MSKKKIFWILLLVLVVAAVVAVVVFVKPKDNTDTATTNGIEKNTEGATTQVASNKKYEKVELDDGTLYAVNGEKVESDIVLGDEYFDTTINDIYLNPQSYENKNIEISGMYLTSEPYTFVGRYSTSNICPYCPAGYSYMEYQLGGTIDKELEDEADWIKVVGTLQKGNDESSGYQDYYYLDVANLEIMNERGQETVTN